MRDNRSPLLIAVSPEDCGRLYNIIGVVTPGTKQGIPQSLQHNFIRRIIRVFYPLLYMPAGGIYPRPIHFISSRIVQTPAFSFSQAAESVFSLLHTISKTIERLTPKYLCMRILRRPVIFRHSTSAAFCLISSGSARAASPII